MSALQKAQELANRASLTNRQAQRRAASDSAMRQFAEDFRLVADHYGMTHVEREELRDLAKTYSDEQKLHMQECYAAIANSLRNAVRADGINQRIRASIEAEKRKAA